MSDQTDAKSTKVRDLRTNQPDRFRQYWIEMSVDLRKVRYYGNKERHEHPAKGLPRHPAPGRHVEPPPRDDDGRQDGHGKNTWNSKFGPSGGRNEIDQPDSVADDEQGVRYHIRKN